MCLGADVCENSRRAEERAIRHFSGSMALFRSEQTSCRQKNVESRLGAVNN